MDSNALRGYVAFLNFILFCISALRILSLFFSSLFFFFFLSFLLYSLSLFYSFTFTFDFDFHFYFFFLRLVILVNNLFIFPPCFFSSFLFFFDFSPRPHFIMNNHLHILLHGWLSSTFCLTVLLFFLCLASYKLINPFILSLLHSLCIFLLL